MTARNTAPIVDKKDLLNLIRIFAKNWYILIFFIGVALIYANILIQQSTNIHKLTTTVLLKTEFGDNLSDEVIKGLGISRKSEDIANELRIINSSEVVEKTVNKMQMEVSYFITGRLKTFEVFGNLPFQVDAEVISNSFYNVPVSLDVVSSSGYILNYSLNGIPQPAVKGFFDIALKTKSFRVMISKTEKFKNNMIDDYREARYSFRINNLQTVVEKYKKAITVKDLDWTSIVEISLLDEIPTRGTRFLDTLTSVYIESSLQSKKVMIDQTIGFIDQLIADVLRTLNDYQANMEEFKHEHGKIDIDTEKAKYIERLTEYDSQYEQLEVQLKNFDEIKKYLLSYNDTEFFSPPFKNAATDNFVSTSLQNLYDLVLANQKNTLARKKENLEYKASVAQVNFIIENLVAYLNTTGSAIRKMQSSMKEKQKEYESRLEKIPPVERELLNIQRRLDVNQKMYEFLLEKKSESIIRKAGIVPNRKVIELAKPVGIVSPNRSQIINYALGIAIVLSLTIIFIRKTFFDTIDGVEDLKQLTEIPIIGAVNRDKDGQNSYLLVENKSRSVIAESFRSIRNNLEYLATDSKQKIILVTSTRVGEGKTFTSINLATIFAKAGRRTVILEFDLHKPKIQRAFNMSNEKGLSSIIIGKSTLDECIKKSPIENLDVIVSGPLPPNSSELILSPRVGELLNELREKYEYIVVDTPPIGIISDALAMMKYADLNLYVMKAFSSKTSFIENIHSLRENFKPKNLGIILNGVRTRLNSGYGKFGSSDGYTYGYGPGMVK